MINTYKLTRKINKFANMLCVCVKVNGFVVHRLAVVEAVGHQ